MRSKYTVLPTKINLKAEIETIKFKCKQIIRGVELIKFELKKILFLTGIKFLCS